MTQKANTPQVSEELQALIDKSKEKFKQFKPLTFEKRQFYELAIFDTDKDGMKYYDEPREEEEELEFDNYGLSDKEVISIIENLCKDKCPTRDEIQKELKNRAESIFMKGSI